MTEEREYEVRFTVRSTSSWITVPKQPVRNGHKEMRAIDGSWYRVPTDAEIKDVTPLPFGYYFISQNKFVYAVHEDDEGNASVQIWNGTEWVASDIYEWDSRHEWRDKAQYIGPINDKLHDL